MDPKQMFWSRFKINAVCIAILGAAIAVFLVHPPSQKRLDNSAMSLGDYPEFYSASLIVSQGLGSRLYDFHLQKQIQTALSATYKALPFPYPPYTAVLLIPLAHLPLWPGKWVFVGLMAVCLVLSIKTAARYTPTLRHNWLAIIAFLVFFYPISRGVLLAQNTALSMLLYAGASWGLSQKTKRGEYLCGLCLGLWLFKPQYALIIIGLFLFSKSWRIVATASVVGFLYYLLGVFVMGPLWPVSWLNAIRELNQGYYPHYIGDVLSIPSALTAVAAPVGLKAGTLTLVAGLLIFLFWKAGHNNDNEGRYIRLQKLLDLMGPAVLLLSPYPFLYEIGLCLLPIAKHLKLNTDLKITVFMVLVYAGCQMELLKTFIPIQPFFFVVLSIFFYLLRRLI